MRGGPATLAEGAWVLSYDPRMAESKPRVVTGDTPTGRLHLGHYVGSIENSPAQARCL